MFNFTRTLGSLALALAGLGLQAEDFQPLMSVAKTTWPEKTHIGVVCEYRNVEQEVMDLAWALGPEVSITVADTHSPDDVNKAVNALSSRHVDFMVMMPSDRIVRDGSFHATLAISRLASRGIPTVGTSAAALSQGAVFSIGAGTGGELLVTNKLIGTVDVILPDRVTFSKKASLLLTDARANRMASIVVVPAK